MDFDGDSCDRDLRDVLQGFGREHGGYSDDRNELIFGANLVDFNLDLVFGPRVERYVFGRGRAEGLLLVHVVSHGG